MKQLIEAAYSRISFVPVYTSVLENALPPLQQVARKDWRLLIPYALTCAATLECILNEAIIQYSVIFYGFRDYERHARALLSLSLSAKLDYLFPFVTRNQYTIKVDSATYKRLKRLISVRNDLTHNKPFAQEMSFQVSDKGTNFTSHKSKLLNSFETALTYKNCSSFFESVQEINKALSDPKECRSAKWLTKPAW